MGGGGGGGGRLAAVRALVDRGGTGEGTRGLFVVVFALPPTRLSGFPVHCPQGADGRCDCVWPCSVLSER